LVLAGTVYNLDTGSAWPKVWLESAGGTWIDLSAGAAAFKVQGWLEGAIADGEGIVAWGASRENDPLIWRTEDLQTWTRATLADAAYGHLAAVTPYRDGYVAVGQSETWVSEDGGEWFVTATAEDFATDAVSEGGASFRRLLVQDGYLVALASVGLTEAEAVAGVIRAESDTQLRASRRMMDGEMSQAVGSVRDELAELLALVEADIDFAEAFVAVTPNDNTNLMAAQVAKEVFGVPRTIARLDDPARADAYRALDVDYVAGAHLISRVIQEQIVQAEFNYHVTFSSGDVEIVEMDINPLSVREAGRGAKPSSRLAFSIEKNMVFFARRTPSTVTRGWAAPVIRAQASAA
jgi:hypothetical protein